MVILQEWQDVNMQWNKSEYGDVGDIRVPPSRLWKPDVLMYNRYGVQNSDCTKMCYKSMPEKNSVKTKEESLY